MKRKFFGVALALAGLANGQMVAATVQSSEPILATEAGAAYKPQDSDERGLWMQVDEEERRIKTSNFLVRDAALNAYVRDVFCRTVGPECASIRIYILRTPYFNASMAPNGMMQIWSGLFLRLHDEAQLAAILGHEYVHFKNQHSLKLFRAARSKSGSATFMSMFGLLGSLIALGQLASVFEFSRDMESEADRQSLQLMTHGGYQPESAARIWQQLRAEQDATAAARQTKSRKDKNGGIFATHPPTAERLAALKALAASTPADPSRIIGRERYRAALSSAWPSLIDDQIKMNDLGATEFLINQLAEEGWTAGLSYARGEMLRARGRPEDLAAAELSYRAAIADPVAPPEAWRGLGLTLLRSSKADEGKVQLKAYLDRKPDASDRAIIAMMAGA